MFGVMGGSVVVVSKGNTVAGENSTGVKYSFVKLYNTYVTIPRARTVPRMRRIEGNLGSMLFGLASADTFPSLNSFTGWRKKTTLASFPFISATEPKKTLHWQLVRV